MANVGLSADLPVPQVSSAPSSNNLGTAIMNLSTGSTTTIKPKSGSKARISLLSSKQPGMRINSDEDQTTLLSNPQPPVPLRLATNNTNDDYQASDRLVKGPDKEFPSNNERQPISSQNLNPNQSNSKNFQHDIKSGSSHIIINNNNNTNTTTSTSTNINSDDGSKTAGDVTKISASKEDLILLLSLLKSELQSKEIALAATKCEQLKRLLNPVEINRSCLAKTYMQLQDKLNEISRKQHDQNNNDPKEQLSTKEHGSKSETISTTPSASIESLDASKKIEPIFEHSDPDNLDILNALLELLDRHPLLALPRDSIYCLDYNCNEQSTKNYLNLKIQHLDTLINQHRHFRYLMNEHLKRAQQRCAEFARELELERELRFKDSAIFKAGGRVLLLKQIDQLTETLEQERRSKHEIVMTLLNDLLDEREKNKALSNKLAQVSRDLKSRPSEAENVKKLELDFSSRFQLQETSYNGKKDELHARIAELEKDNAALKAQLVEQDKLISNNTPVMSGLVKTPPPSTSRQINHNRRQERATPAMRQSLIGSATPTKQILSSSPSQTTASVRPPVASRQSLSSQKSDVTPSNSTSSSSNHSPTNTAAARGSPQLSNRSRGPVDYATGLKEQMPIKIQPLFKSASLSSTSNQVKNSKLHGSTSGPSGSPIVPGLSTRSASLSVKGSSMTKPQVPAKPAQLLEQQRNSIN